MANPDYVVINRDSSPSDKKAWLQKPLKDVTFPLSEEDKEVIRILKEKFDAEDNCAGLAANQIGFKKRIFIFAVEATEEIKKFRPDLTDVMPRSVWINPSYEPIGKETHPDYEGCFSVDDLAGIVRRYKTIRYTATLETGETITGIANGFLARVIQHETDHTRGILFTDIAEPNTVKSVEEHRADRRKVLEESKGESS